MNTEISSKNPSAWNTFERMIDGSLRKFWIQVLPETYMDVALDYLCKYLLRDEPLCKCLRLIEDEEGVEESKQMWADAIIKKCTLACFTKLDNGDVKLVALNCCSKTSASDEEIIVKSQQLKTISDLLEFISKIRNTYQTFEITEYLSSFGLLTIPEYRGHNIGLELLNARKCLAKDLGLTVSLTVFTAPASQRLAEKAGFQDFVSITFDEIEKNDPPFIIPDIRAHSKCLRFMYIVYE